MRKPVALLTRLRKKYSLFWDAVNGEIQRGVSPDVVDMHVLTKAQQRKEKLEPEILRKSLSGVQIKRYQPWKSDQYIIYVTTEAEFAGNPRAARYIRKFRHLNTCEEVEGKKHPWWRVHRPRKPEIFDSPNFIGLTTNKTIELVYDEKDSLYVTDAMCVFALKQHIDPWAALAVLQSKLFLFLYRVTNQGESRVIPQVKAAKLGGLPFPNLAESKLTGTLSDLAKRMCALKEQLASERAEHIRNELQRQITSMDAEIERLVNALYGLTEAECKLVDSMEVKLLGMDQEQNELAFT